jgi:hypothetical protein
VPQPQLRQPVVQPRAQAVVLLAAQELPVVELAHLDLPVVRLVVRQVDPQATPTRKSLKVVTTEISKPSTTISKLNQLD